MFRELPGQVFCACVLPNRGYYLFRAHVKLFVRYAELQAIEAKMLVRTT